MRRAALVVLSFAAACGGSDDSNSDALLSGAVTGNYDTTDFTVATGVLGVAQGATVVALSSDILECSTLSANSPPKGEYAAIVVPTLAVGSYTGVQVEMYQNNGNFESIGSSDGTLDVTAITDTTLSGTIAYSTTLDGKSYAINGTFEVNRCK